MSDQRDDRLREVAEAWFRYVKCEQWAHGTIVDKWGPKVRRLEEIERDALLSKHVPTCRR